MSPSSAPSDMSTKKVPSLIYWSPSPWSLSVYLVLYKEMFIDSWPYIVGWDVGLVHRVVGVHLASSCHEDMETGSYSWQHRGQLPEAPHGLAWARSNWHEVPIEPVGLSATPVQRCPLNTALPRCGGLMTSTLLKRTILWSSKSCKASLRIHLTTLMRLIREPSTAGLWWDRCFAAQQRRRWFSYHLLASDFHLRSPRIHRTPPTSWWRKPMN